MSTVVSFRLNEERMERLRRAGRAMGKAPGEVASLLVEEGLRMREHPGIDFRDTPVGRQAFIRGTRLQAWMILRMLRGEGDDLKVTCENYSLTEREVLAALNYGRCYVAELEEAERDTLAAGESIMQELLATGRARVSAPA